MYRDSDGYILIDMGAADISKSTQSIVGFYDRIVESVDANKLVLVINFGTYSPMPAIAHKKLNYYEIVTNLYKITINSNDIVIIEETGESTVDVSIVPTLQEGVKVADFAIGEVEGSIYAPEQVDVINDNVTASNTTWSSDKIDNELDKKADSSSLATVATSGSYTDLTNKPTIPADLDDLSDVTLTTPTNGQTLVYDSTSEQFVNATPPSGVTALSQLSDVSLTTPASGNSLVFDGTEWANDTLAAADIPYSQGVSVADKLDNVPTFDTLTTSDNNKLLYVSVSGGDISVGAVYRDVRSTTEKRVGTWINGKPLYEKIITFTNSASSTADYVQVEQIPNLAIATQINWTFKRVTGGNTFWYTGSGASNPEIDTQYSNYKIAFRVLNGWLEYGFVGYAGHWLTDCYVRVQYTKTTD